MEPVYTILVGIGHIVSSDSLTKVARVPAQRMVFTMQEIVIRNFQFWDCAL